MVQEKRVYEVNGKQFDNKEEALKEELKSGVKYKEIAEKYVNVLSKVSLVGEVIKSDEIVSVLIEVKDKEISPEWFVNKPYYNAFLKILKELNIDYVASDGDERLSAFFKITPMKIDKIPSVEELAKQIPIILEGIDKKHQEYLDKLIGRNNF